VGEGIIGGIRLLGNYWGDKVVGELMRGIWERRIRKKGRTWEDLEEASHFYFKISER